MKFNVGLIALACELDMTIEFNRVGCRLLLDPKWFCNISGADSDGV